MPKRINKAIESLEQGHPVDDTGARDLSHAGGKAMAKTWAGCVTIDMEAARDRVKSACEDAGVSSLNGVTHTP